LGTQQFNVYSESDQVYAYEDYSRDTNLAFGLSMYDVRQAKNPHIVVGCVLFILKGAWRNSAQKKEIDLQLSRCHHKLNTSLWMSGTLRSVGEQK